MKEKDMKHIHKIIYALTFAMLFPLLANAEEEGFKPLFNGKDLTGWDGNPDLWSVKDGIIVGQTTKEKPTKGNTFIIWRGSELNDFELRLSFKIANGNSGVQYRSKEMGKWVMGGYQCDIRSPAYETKDPKNCTGKIYSEKVGRGQMAFAGEKVVYDKDGKKNVVGQVNEVAKINKALDNSEWKDLIIIAKGNQIVQKLNSEIVCELTDDDEAKRTLSGLLGLQIHAGAPMTVYFKDIRLKELK
jgi:hypothetical protein